MRGWLFCSVFATVKVKRGTDSIGENIPGVIFLMSVLFVFSYGGRDTGQKSSVQVSALS